ncbi:MAG: hypothetical protein MZU95_00760 [Desulfomicrobium escambiense]|nr:hypothetical protein [Desulfomicrobium escambiense]
MPKKAARKSTRAGYIIECPDRGRTCLAARPSRHHRGPRPGLGPGRILRRAR